LHCCRFCEFYDAKIQSYCLDERAEPPSNKESANFCEYFKPRHDAYINQSSIKSNLAKNNFNALFDEVAAADVDTADVDTDAAKDAKAEEENTTPTVTKNPLDGLFDD